MKTNPNKPFFTRDLIVDQGEPINSFWGYHIANNYDRLMGVDGTIFFKSRPPTLGDEVTDVYFDIPLGNLGLRSIPIVQFYTAHVETQTSYTISTPGVHDFHVTLLSEEGPDDPILSAAIDLSKPEDYKLSKACKEFLVREDAAGKGFYLSFGAGVEVAFVKKYYIVDNAFGKMLLSLETERGWDVTGGESHALGEAVYFISHDGLVKNETTTVATTWHINSPLVEGVMDAEKLRVRWLWDGPGTVYYKIFGV